MQKFCQNCNQVNPAEAAFCRQCASPLNAAQPQQQHGTPPPQFGNQQQWGQPNYGTPQMQNFAQAGGGASSRATAAAGLAVAALFCCGFLTGIPAAIMGWLEIQAIKEGKSSPAGMTMAQVGLWLGIIGTVINAVANIIGVLFLGLLNTGGGY